MQPLDKTLRNRLDRTVRKARPVAEQAAEAALEQLGVGEETPPSYLSEDQRALRRRLRAHARSLGDPLKEGTQAVTRLIGEIAYEHWHRMLFARFLAENELLMYDGVAVTLEECEELADELNEERAEQGQRTSGWALAARLASTMLPQVFRVDSPVFELTLAAEYQRDLEGLLVDLPSGSISRQRQPGLGLPVLADRQQGAHQPLRGEDRRRRAARRHPALHRALHGQLPAG